MLEDKIAMLGELPLSAEHAEEVIDMLVQMTHALHEGRSVLAVIDGGDRALIHSFVARDDGRVVLLLAALAEHVAVAAPLTTMPVSGALH